MGRSEKRELISRLKIVLLHLLKWQFQPSFRGGSWQLSIREQRAMVIDHLADNPSLKATLAASIATAYRYAKFDAQRQTGMPERAFPANCPYTFEQLMDANFWPD